MRNRHAPRFFYALLSLALLFAQSPAARGALSNLDGTARPQGVGQGVAPAQDNTRNRRAPVLFRDEFTAPAGAANAGRRPHPVNNVSAVWTAGAGAAWTVRSNRAEPPDGYADGAFQYADARASDFTYAATLTGFDGGDNATKAMPGMMLRFEDANNFLLLQFDTFQHTATLYDCTGGVFTPLASGVGPGSDFGLPVTVTADGPLVTVAVPGQVPFQATTRAHINATRVGLRAGKSTGTPAGRPRFDDVAVLPLLARDASNPQLVKGTAGTWESGDVAAPGMSYDPRKARFVRLYSGYDAKLKRWCTGVAYAPTPRGRWTKEPTNPRLCPASGEGYIAASASKPVYKNGLWYVVYQGAPNASAGNPATPWRVYAASSPDLLKWTRLNGGEPVLPLGAIHAFDQTGQHDPDLRLRDDGLFEVTFSGRSGSGVFTAGYATSLDMKTWTATRQYAVLGSFGAGDGILNVAVRGTDPLNYSLYFCHQSSSLRWAARSDTSDGGVTWTYYPGVLFKKSGWESAQVFDLDSLVVGNVEYVSYSGATSPGGTEGMNSGIGLATLTLPNADDVEEPGRRTRTIR